MLNNQLDKALNNYYDVVGKRISDILLSLQVADFTKGTLIANKYRLLKLVDWEGFKLTPSYQLLYSFSLTSLSKRSSYIRIIEEALLKLTLASLEKKLIEKNPSQANKIYGHLVNCMWSGSPTFCIDLGEYIAADELKITEELTVTELFKICTDKN
jgi:hypothetical protein